MKEVRFISFWLLLTVGMATVVFNSCGKDDDSKDEQPDDKNKPSTVAVTGISLNKPTLTLLMGETHDFIATITPNDATDKTVTWTSSDESKATVDRHGRVKAAYRAGTATITAKAGDQTDSCIVTVKINPPVYDEGVIINGVKWATRNVAAPGTFAANLEDAGMFYQWNRKVGWSSIDPIVNSNGGTNWDNSIPGGIKWEKTNDPSPVGWRVPTLGEIQKLLDTDNVDSKWATENGIAGRKFIDKATNNSIFLPAAGYRSVLNNDGALAGGGTSGRIWCSTQFNSVNAYNLRFNSENVNSSENGNSYGYSVRCVAE